jgi:hypothetical protein
MRRAVAARRRKGETCLEVCGFWSCCPRHQKTRTPIVGRNCWRCVGDGLDSRRCGCRWSGRTRTRHKHYLLFCRRKLILFQYFFTPRPYYHRNRWYRSWALRGHCSCPSTVSRISIPRSKLRLCEYNRCRNSSSLVANTYVRKHGAAVH